MFMLTTCKGDLPSVVIKQSQNFKQDGVVLDLINDSCRTLASTFFK